MCNRAGDEERDLVNFPKLVRAEHPGPVRLGFIPEEWFAFFYDKTGVTGPYVFFTSVATYLCSKEIYVLEHNYYNGLSIAVMLTLAVKKLGPTVAAYADKLNEDELNEMNDAMSNDKKYCEEEIAREKLFQWRGEGELLLMAAKRANVAMQLEAEYRARLWRVYSEVMRRLNCTLDVYAMERYFHQQHLVQWVVAEVTKCITPEINNQYIRLCIEEVARLAPKK